MHFLSVGCTGRCWSLVLDYARSDFRAVLCPLGNAKFGNARKRTRIVYLGTIAGTARFHWVEY